MQSRVFTDVLRRIPGVQVSPVRGPQGSGDTVRMTRMSGTSGFRPCPVLYYMNGHLMPVTGDVSEIVGPALLLASDAGSYMTGQVVSVDGGLTVH